MKQICSLLVLLISMISCGGQNKTFLPKDRIGDSISKAKTYDTYADIISSGLKDKNGNLWFAAAGRGVYRYDGISFSHFTTKEGLRGDNVACIYEDRVGKLWFGTDMGVCVYDGKTFSDFNILDNDSTAKKAPKSEYFKKTISVSRILQDKNENFWFVTMNNGVYRYNGKTFSNFLTHEVLDCISEDKSGNIWVGSWNHGGVYRYDGSFFNHINGFSDDMIQCMLEDKKGNIWIGTRDHGVDRYDGKSIVNYSEKDNLNNSISCMLEDENGNIWLGSDVSDWGKKRGGAYRYDGKSFTEITSKENLTLKEDILYGVMTIVEDKNGNFWFGSRGGLLLHYDGKTFTDFSGKLSR
jgi:ligand-binding sensor domain-containing protein